MKPFLILLLSVAMTSATNPLSGTVTREYAYKTYANFVGGTWETKGKWDGGAEFHQEILVETYTYKVFKFVNGKGGKKYLTSTYRRK